MPTAGSTVWRRVWSQRNLTIVVAILIGIPVAYAFYATVGTQSGSFLLLFILGVGVPTTYDTHWPRYDRPSQAIAWIVVACALATIEYVALYRLGTRFGGLSPFYAEILAFLVTYLGSVLLIARWGPSR